MWRTRFKLPIGIAAALMLAMTSMTMAVARGQARVAGEVVLCTGYGVTTVSVDAEGKPTSPAHICPDMVLAMMAAVALAPALPAPPRGEGRSVETVEPETAQAQAVLVPRARGPPVTV
ncbi:hypothetical protein [Thioclava sp. F36-6]|uniref:hypothetical protein n=1 Tax=Thioclava sp. F36-6 TaxID=1915316 RepID=UPI000995E8A5|nr:hypothetical protein [Thioclava sp. F36-6]OOY32951.1 hypothetical protein BMI88_03550 [Thioclava sp. F36-6]